MTRLSLPAFRLTTPLQRGFTLIEVLITVVIVAILAAIAVLSYSQYILRSARADAQAFMADVALRQQQRLVDKRSYAASLSDLGVSTPGSLNGKYNFSFTPAVTATTFTLVATPQGNQANGPCAMLSLTHSGTRSPSNCWN